MLAGCNAARWASGLPLVQIPTSLCTGDAIAHVREEMKTEQGLGCRYTFSGSVYFERMKQKGLYVTDAATIRSRVAAAGLSDVFARPAAARPATACVAAQ